MEFLIRSGCGLCDVAKPIVLRVARLTGLEVTITNVSANDELFDRYEHRIPVVLSPAGTVMAEGQITFWPLLFKALGNRLRSRESSPPTAF